MTREEILLIAKPILFNTEMVHAILDDRKTATRRLMKLQPVLQNHIWLLDGAGWSDGVVSVPVMIGHSLYRKARYKPGDYLYVRETWCNVNKPEYKPDYYYFADTRICEDYDSTEWTWRPSIHMPKEAARIFLRVKDVRIEQLQAMTLDDFLSEGVVLRPEAFNDPENAYQQAKRNFIDIWDSTTNELKYKWNASPWVWVIEFERMIPG